MARVIIPTCLVDVSTEKRPNRIAKVSPEDFHWVSAYKWCSDKDGYAIRFHRFGGKQNMLTIHRRVADAQPGVTVDHINADKLDNRRENVRLATKAQNTANTRRHSWRLKGVSRRNGRFVAKITVDRRTTYLGTFDTEEAAARAYDAAALTILGEFAVLNFPVRFRAAKVDMQRPRYWKTWYVAARGLVSGPGFEPGVSSPPDWRDNQVTLAAEF